MELSLVKTLGQIAGIGGLGISLVIIIFRDIIRKNIFPKLSKKDSFKLFKLIIILSWSIALLGILTWTFLEKNIKMDKTNNNDTINYLKSTIPKRIFPVINLSFPLEYQIRLFPEDRVEVFATPGKLKKVWFGYHWEEYIRGAEYIVWGIDDRPVIPKFEFEGEGYIKLCISYTKYHNQQRDLRNIDDNPSHIK